MQRQQFDLFTSQLVLDEAADGEAAKASERLQLLAGIPLLDLNDPVRALAKKLVSTGIRVSRGATPSISLPQACIE